MSNNIHKVWGERRRIFLNNKSEIDLLYLKKNTFCSTHSHKSKLNKFIVVKGKVRIETDFGKIVLKKNESFEVPTPRTHRFVALTDAVMIEIAFVNKGKIDLDDIQRKIQGGRIINGKYLSIPELRKKGYLELSNEENNE